MLNKDKLQDLFYIFDRCQDHLILLGGVIPLLFYAEK